MHSERLASSVAQRALWKFFVAGALAGAVILLRPNLAFADVDNSYVFTDGCLATYDTPFRDSCDDCVTQEDDCINQCYYCFVNGDSQTEYDACEGMCRQSMSACFRDGPCQQ